MRSASNLVQFVRDKYDIAESGPRPPGGLKSRTGEEYVKAMEELEPLNITDGFIEIGSAWGGSFHMWSTIISGPKISVDLMIHGEKRAFARRNEIWNVYFTEVHSILGDSHEQLTVDEVEEVLNGNQVGFLYIDGDHTYEGVKADYEMYKHFVRTGGRIGIHDTMAEHEGEVMRFWNDFKSTTDLKVSEFITSPGIGLIHVGENE